MFLGLRDRSLVSAATAATAAPIEGTCILMPSSPHSRKDPAGSAKTLDSRQVIDLFGFIGLHQLDSVLSDMVTLERKGRPTVYPPTALFGCLVAARVAASQPEALKIIRAHWEECRTKYKNRSGVTLPRVPPNHDHVRYFRKRLLARPGLLNQLQQQFQLLAIGQARKLGNLLPGVTPDWANLDPAFSIYGDGTVIKPASNVRVVAHPITGELKLVGSNAGSLDRAKIQRVLSDTSEDGKTARGVMMVALHTWTPAGRVVLGTGTALGAEVWTALDLVDSIHAKAGDGIHTLIYDRAITGRSVDYLMGALRIQLLSKAVGARKSSNASESEIPDPDLNARVNRLCVEYNVTPGSVQAHLLRRQVLADMSDHHAKRPVGLNIYPTQRGNFDLTHGEVMEIEDAVHTTDRGECRHPLVVDDGALLLVEDHEEETYRVKTRLLTCESSTPLKRSDGRWGTRNSYTVPCEAGDFTYERKWLPEGIRYTAETPRTKKERPAPADGIGWRLRPLNRADDFVELLNEGTPVQENTHRRFSEHFSRRNDSESYNNWYKNTLPIHGRASTCDIAGQELDFMCGAILNNSLTWHNR